MGNSVSRVVGCFVPVSRNQERVGMCFSEPLDEGLGHSFCYIRPPLDSPHFSPGHSDRFNLPFPTDTEAHSSSFRSNSNENIVDRCRVLSETPFKSISGASVSANTSTPRTAVCHEYFHSFTNVPDDRHAAFESTASFASLPLQPIPRNATLSGPISGPLSGPLSGSMDRGFMSGPIERAFMSGPLERGTMSGSLERGYMSGPIEMPVDRSHFSAPLAGYFRRRKRPKAVSRFINSVSKPVKGVLRRSLSKTTSTFVRTQKTLVAPIRKLVWSRLLLRTRQANLYDSPSELGYASSDMDLKEFQNLQWAQGKAGEDRVHVVISEEHGWLFVGIYDGFNGPDAPDFLMRNLYRAIYRELQGLLWDQGADCEPLTEKDGISSEVIANNLLHPLDLIVNTKNVVVKTSSSDEEMASQNIIEQQPDLSGQHSTQRSCGEVAGKVSWEKIQGEPERLTCNENCIQDTDVKVATSSNVDMADDRSSSNAQTQSCVDNLARSSLSDTNTRLFITEKSSNAWSSRSFIRPSFRHRKARNKESHRKMLPQRHDPSKVLLEPADQVHVDEPVVKQWTHGLNNHNDVLKALASALEDTEEAYLDMADQALDENPELALIGSCILVVLMKDKDVYVLNVGDSRAIIAQSRNWPGLEPESCFNSNMDTVGRIGSMRRQDLERIVEESPMDLETFETSKYGCTAGPPPVSLSLRAVQLSTDHDTSIEEETWRIKAEHPDDNLCILNDRVKGRLKVTRAFGAGFLKKPRWNNAILKRFQIDYVGTAPYISCIPALRHHRLGPKDRFLILSSDGLYQYFTNEEVVSHVEWFMEKFPEGDPAQHLIEELLFRAAKKAGMDFHELLDIPQGDRRKYHDDVSVMVISLEGKIWRSSG